MEVKRLERGEAVERLWRVELAVAELQTGELRAAEEARGNSELSFPQLEDELLDTVPGEEEEPLVDVGAAVEEGGGEVELVDGSLVEEEDSGDESDEVGLDEGAVGGRGDAFLVEDEVGECRPFVSPFGG